MFVETVFKRPSRIGIIFGIVFMAYSLTPSLIPRSWVEQAAIAALSFLCAYGIGVGITALWRYLQLPVVPKAYQSRFAWILLAAGAIFLLFFVYRSLGWQNNVRQTVGLGPAKSVDPVRMLLLATVLSAILLLIFRSLWWLARGIVRLVNRLIPRRVGQVIGIAIAALVVFFLINGRAHPHHL